MNASVEEAAKVSALKYSNSMRKQASQK